MKVLTGVDIARRAAIQCATIIAAFANPSAGLAADDMLRGMSCEELTREVAIQTKTLAIQKRQVAAARTELERLKRDPKSGLTPEQIKKEEEGLRPEEMIIPEDEALLKRTQARYNQICKK